jgi:hypothetical protein
VKIASEALRYCGVSTTVCITMYYSIGHHS